MLVEMLNQCVYDFVWDKRLSGPVRRRLVPIDGEHTAQFVVGVGHLKIPLKSQTGPKTFAKRG
jgi:hypothetical protein